MSRLEKITIPGCSYIVDENSGVPVFHVSDAHALIQATGYIKHVFASENAEGIYFRGQTRLYQETPLVPTLFRGCSNKATLGKRQGNLNSLIREIRKKNTIFSKFDERVHEPILQHYGIRTTWIDLVDNIWVALWFATRKARFTGPFGRYLHFEKRSVDDPLSENAFAYILLIGAEVATMNKYVPGFYQGKTTELIDLRMAAPSIFLRPHAQHAVLFRLRGDAVCRQVDYGNAVRGVIRTRLEDAFRWLGEGTLLEVHHLFPPPVYDRGYEYLLCSNPVGIDYLGAINHIGA